MHAKQPLIRLKTPGFTPIGRTLTRPARRPLERLLSIDRVNRLYAEAAAGQPGPDDFLRHLLEQLDVTCHLPTADLERVPATGPAIVVANHPFGALDGILLAAALRTVRPDVKIL